MNKHVGLAAGCALALLLGNVANVQAEILPAHGPGQIGYDGAILCQELTVREEPNAASKAVSTLKYGDFIIVMEQQDGWAHLCVSDDVDGKPVGWVNAEYLAVDPARYRTEDKTPVYAWNDTAAPKVALLDADTTLPILREDGDWLIVSLRGAVGWIHKTATDVSTIIEEKN